MTTFSVSGNGLLPHDDAARAMLSKFKLGDLVDVSVLNPINTKFNNKIMRTIAELAKMQVISFDAMKAKLLVMTGNFEVIEIPPNKKKVLVVDSLSRITMTMAKREIFWNEMRLAVRSEILPKLSHKDAETISVMMSDTEVVSNV